MRVSGSRTRFRVLGFRTWRLGVWVEGLCGCGGQEVGFECRIEGQGFRVTGLGIMADGFIYLCSCFSEIRLPVQRCRCLQV